MNTAQVTTVLSEIGSYSVNALIPLTEVNAIVLEGNKNIYTDDNVRFYFKTGTNLGLMLAYGGVTDSDGVFTQISDKPAYAVSFEQIEAFQLVSKYRRRSPYKFGTSM